MCTCLCECVCVCLCARVDICECLCACVCYITDNNNTEKNYTTKAPNSNNEPQQHITNFSQSRAPLLAYNFLPHIYYQYENDFWNAVHHPVTVIPSTQSHFDSPNESVPSIITRRHIPPKPNSVPIKKKTNQKEEFRKIKCDSICIFHHIFSKTNFFLKFPNQSQIKKKKRKRRRLWAIFLIYFRILYILCEAIERYRICFVSRKMIFGELKENESVFFWFVSVRLKQFFSFFCLMGNWESGYFFDLLFSSRSIW